MFHLFKHSTGKLKGKYDIALIVKGKYIVGSNQGYNRKRGALSALISICKSLPDWGNLGSCVFQDDTKEKSEVFSLDLSGTTYKSTQKPSKPYTPKSKSV